MPCVTFPSMVGPDPRRGGALGYHGLGREIESSNRDPQRPFDNMAWQMLVAIIAKAGGFRGLCCAWSW